MHLDALHPVALAGLAAPAFDVETKTARLVSADPGGRQPRKQIPDRPKRAGVSHGIGARGAPDRRLVNDDGLVDLVEPENPVVLSRAILGPVKMPEKSAPQDVVDERGLAAS